MDDEAKAIDTVPSGTNRNQGKNKLGIASVSLTLAAIVVTVAVAYRQEHFARVALKPQLAVKITDLCFDTRNVVVGVEVSNRGPTKAGIDEMRLHYDRFVVKALENAVIPAGDTRTGHFMLPRKYSVDVGGRRQIEVDLYHQLEWEGIVDIEAIFGNDEIANEPFSEPFRFDLSASRWKDRRLFGCDN